MRRRAIAFAAVVVVAFLAVTALTITHIATSGDQGCSMAAPLPDLPPQLRAIGGFDQSFDASNPEALAQIASNAAGAVHPNLDGTIPLAPVRERAIVAGHPDAIVVPLEAPQSTGAGTHVAGLVSFLVSCGGRAYFGSVIDLSSIGSGASSTFPAVTEADAAARLGVSTVQLVYITSPFTPEWRSAQSGATIPAGE